MRHEFGIEDSDSKITHFILRVEQPIIFELGLSGSLKQLLQWCGIEYVYLFASSESLVCARANARISIKLES